MTGRLKCYVDDERNIEPCICWEGMLGRTHGGKGGGVELKTMFNIANRVRTGTRMILKSGNSKGTILNFCPWCSASYAKANGVDHEGNDV